ncbi:hypothetical protein LguiB_005626 [Lonicera macranthoides]
MIRTLFRSAALQLHVVSTQTIKPASQTPSRLKQKPEGEAAGLVFPPGLAWANPNNSSSLLVVRLTNFECGGMSIAVLSMRPRVVPPLPKTTMGNLTSIFMTPTRNDGENNLKTLVEKIRKGNNTLRGVKKLDASEYLSMLQEFPYDKYKFFLCSSLCGMPLYKVDFGWGYPSRVTLGDSPTNNGFILMDTPNGDGVEALVSFEEQNMAAFEQDKEILAFTTSH